MCIILQIKFKAIFSIINNSQENSDFHSPLIFVLLFYAPRSEISYFVPFDLAPFQNNIWIQNSLLYIFQKVSPEDNVFSVVNPTIWKEDGNNNNASNKHLTSPPTYRKRNLFNNNNNSSGERKSSLGSSVENSDDEGSHVDSSEENELNNWKDRRRSYLSAKNSSMNTLDPTARIDEADDEDSDVNISSPKSYPKNEEQSTTKVIKEGPLNRKQERANDRCRPISRKWKPFYAQLKGHRLFCYKVGGVDGDDEIIQPIPVRSSIIEIASNYMKRKNVFRMVTSHDNEYLFQAENSTSMREWVAALREANPDKESLKCSTVMQDHGSPLSKEKEKHECFRKTCI